MKEGTAAPALRPVPGPATIAAMLWLEAEAVFLLKTSGRTKLPTSAARTETVTRPPFHDIQNDCGLPGLTRPGSHRQHRRAL